MNFEDEIDDFNGEEYSELFGKRARAKRAARKERRQARRGGFEAQEMDEGAGEYESEGGGSVRRRFGGIRSRFAQRRANRGGGRGFGFGRRRNR